MSRYGQSPSDREKVEVGSDVRASDSKGCLTQRHCDLKPLDA